MTNPYDPPVAEITQPMEARRRSFYAGGYGMVAVLAIVVGVVVGIVINTNFDKNSPFFIWGAPALGWLLALVLLINLMRYSRFSVVGGMLLALGLAVPAYVLYVPVCTVSSMLTQSWIPSGDYGPAPTGIILGSAFAFLVILVAIAAILRVCCKVPDQPAARIREKAIDQQPDNEFS